MAEGARLLEVRDIAKHFPVRGGGVVRAVDGVSLTIDRGETFGLVGESGCGKTTLGRVILRLTPPSGGRVWFGGADVTGLRGSALRAMRRDVQAVFQDPLGSLDPRMTVGATLAEPLRVFGLASRRQAPERVAELLEMVGLDASRAAAHPRRLSGGQRQRVAIARALAVGPRLIVADEPVSALDVSVQAQILNLLADLRERLGVAYLFIAHGLAAVRHVSHRVGVMYLGRIVEVADADTLFDQPAHPYTVALLEAAPNPDPEARGRRVTLPGEPPSATRLPGGCRFRTRCPFAEERCAAEEPAPREVRPGQWVACHFPR